jgi:hypothetical protein
MASPVTQIIYLTVSPDQDLADLRSEAGKRWSEALDLLGGHGGFRRLYWGRSPEDTSKVQLHVGQSTFHFISSHPILSHSARNV